ncbi:Glycosyl hydrolase 47 family protein [Acanthocheilonema viteae]
MKIRTSRTIYALMQKLHAMRLCYYLLLSCILLLLLYFDSAQCVNFPRTLMNKYRDKVKAMFYHAYNSYLLYAYPLDELKPVSCSGVDTWGSFSLTLIDSLDTLLIMGNETEFMRASEIILRTVKVDMNVNVSVFETNIRVIGGLISAHMLSGRVKGMALEPGWPCSGPLLRLAERFAQKLVPAFKSGTGMPYGTINLRHGLHKNETPITCTAGVGTMLLEFGTLSHITNLQCKFGKVSTNVLFLGNPYYEQVALKALDALWKLRSPLNLVGNHINVETGEWTATDAGIGAGVDSYFEYLAKAALLFQRPELMKQFKTYVKAINKYIRKDDWFVWISMTSGELSMPIFQSLESFWPGLLALTGDVDDAQRIIYQYSQVIRQYGFPPEFFNLPKQEAVSKRAGYPLRPEFVESLYYIYRATKDPLLLEIAAEVVDAIEFSCRTNCGYATIVSTEHHSVEDRMESFFLSETTKYLYLLFDPDNFINADGTTARIIETPNGQCIIDAGGYIFNTEAHPLDPAIVYCCSAKRNRDLEMIARFENNIDFISLAGIFDETLYPFGRRSYTENAYGVRNTNKDENLLKQSLINPRLYDYIAVYDDRCLNCCWPTDSNTKNVPFRRFFNAVFAKHIYPAMGIQFIVGLVCLPTGNSIPDGLHEVNWPHVHKVDITQKFDSIDEIRFNKFRYRSMPELGYDILLTSPLSYLSRFTGLGQVKPKPDDI